MVMLDNNVSREKGTRLIEPNCSVNGRVRVIMDFRFLFQWAFIFSAEWTRQFWEIYYLTALTFTLPKLSSAERRAQTKSGGHCKAARMCCDIIDNSCDRCAGALF